MPIMMFGSFCAYVIKGLSGFGNTLIFSAILSFWQDNILITPVDLPLSLLSNFILAWQEHKSLSFRIWGRAAFFMGIGIVPGVLFLKYSNPGIVKVILGCLILFLSSRMLKPAPSEEYKGTSLGNVLLAILAGFFSGLLGIGALISVYMARTIPSLEAFRGNLSILFIVTNSFRVFLYLQTGIMNATTLRISLTLLPCMLIGLWGGVKLSHRLDEKVVRKLIVFFLMVSGLSLILYNWHSLLEFFVK
jgi:uncharacterized membrane protein YfcA